MNEEDMTDLEDYAQSEGCEVGAYTQTLIGLSHCCHESHGASEEFVRHVDAELVRLLGVFKRDYSWEVIPEVIPERILLTKELVYVG